MGFGLFFAPEAEFCTFLLWIPLPFAGLVSFQNDVCNPPQDYEGILCVRVCARAHARL